MCLGMDMDSPDCHRPYHSIPGPISTFMCFTYNHLLFQPQLKLSPSSIGRKISSKILASLISQLCDLELVTYILSYL